MRDKEVQSWGRLVGVMGVSDAAKEEKKLNPYLRIPPLYYFAKDLNN